MREEESMALVSEIGEGFTAIRDVLFNLDRWREEQAGKSEAAIETVLTAANKTRQYKRDLTAGTQT